MADLARIKRNVAKMASQNAPVEDIDGYIASEGVTVDDVRNFRAQPTEPESSQSADLRSDLSAMTQNPKVSDGGGLAGTIDAYGRSTAKAVGMGFMDEIGAWLDSKGSQILPWRTPKTYDQALTEGRADDARLAAAHPGADIAGTVTGALGLGSGLVRAGLSPTARLAQGGRGLLPVSLASGVEGATLGAVQGFGQGEGGFGNRLSSAGEGAKWGAAIGTTLPLAVTGLTSAARRLVTPNTTSQARQGLVNTLEREGVDVTAGQATGSNGLRYAESEIGGQAARDIYERQGEQFTRAALARAGINAERATPEVIDDAFTRIGQRFDDLGANNNLLPDRQLTRDIADPVREYLSVTPPSARAPIILETVRDLNNAFMQRQPFAGTAYQAMRSRLERMARGTNDPNLANALRGIRSALDDGMERSIAATNPGELGAFREVRNQYRNMLVLEQAATAAGENAAGGLISPSALRNATVSKQGRRNYARGNGDFAELARAGEGVMKPMPQSGTAPRTAIRNMGAAVPSLLGAGAGGVAGGGVGAMAGMVAGAAVPQVVGRLMMTPAGQAYLRNQLMAGNINPQTRAAVVAAINQIDANFLPSLTADGRSQVPSAAAR